MHNTWANFLLPGKVSELKTFNLKFSVNLSVFLSQICCRFPPESKQYDDALKTVDHQTGVLQLLFYFLALYFYFPPKIVWSLRHKIVGLSVAWTHTLQSCLCYLFWNNTAPKGHLRLSYSHLCVLQWYYLSKTPNITLILSPKCPNLVKYGSIN